MKLHTTQNSNYTQRTTNKKTSKNNENIKNKKKAKILRHKPLFKKKCK